MSFKACIACGGKFHITSFYKHKQMKDGHLNRCIACVKQAVTYRRNSNIDAVRAYDRARGNLPHRIQARAAYQNTPAGKEAIARAKDKWAQENKWKRESQYHLTNAVRDRRIVKLPCIVCGNESSDGHHVAYDLPLAVSWLCRKHHAQTHKEHRMIERGEAI